MSERAKIGYDSPVGPLVLRERDGAIVSLGWGRPRSERQTPLLLSAAGQLEGYFSRKREAFELPLAPEGEEFDRRVWREMQAIPYGRTLTYGEIASRLGGDPRDVGTACGRNPLPILIPCHRVVGANGALVGYSGARGLETKQALLALEGVLLPL